jgi:hypothetical protein
MTLDFTARVNRAIDGEPSAASPAAVESRAPRWWRSFAGVGLAAGVAAIAVVSYQQRVIAPPSMADSKGAATAIVAHNVLGSGAVAATPNEALSYTVPQAGSAPAVAMPAARLTNYVFAHSKYSAVMGQNDVLNDLLSEADAQDPHVSEASQDSRAAP